MKPPADLEELFLNLIKTMNNLQALKTLTVANIRRILKFGFRPSFRQQ